MARQGRASKAGEGGGERAPQGQGPDVHDSAGALAAGPLELPAQSPLFYAEQADRYERQRLIKAYEERFGCRLIVMSAPIFGESVTFFEELIYDASGDQDLHLILDSPGGDGETAVRLVRSAQARCRELSVIVPDQAKSAATLLAMGAHCILMGPTSDLGPVDPQFMLRPGHLVAAKDIIAAVEAAERAIALNPDTYPLHASLLSDVSALMVQQARSALARTDDLVAEALRSNPDRSESEVAKLRKQLKEPLIDLPTSHGAIFGARDAMKAGLPVVEADPASDQWRIVWRLWALYFNLGHPVYE
ncbi:MAG: SDH family Clp fold serine proteinase, partial [Acidimicrobiia bacterium]